LMSAGLEWTPPTWLGIVAAFGTGALMAPRVVSPAGFWRGTALCLATFFLLSRQAMPNYWYLVAVTALLGSETAAPGTTERTVEGTRLS
jgi:hypothetical protein